MKVGAIMHLYHMCFLAHMVGLKPLNFPYFLHKSLIKIITKARGPQGINPRSVFHQGLIKLLFVHATHNRHEPIPRPRVGSRKNLARTVEKEVSGSNIRNQQIEAVARRNMA